MEGIGTCTGARGTGTDTGATAGIDGAVFLRVSRGGGRIGDTGGDWLGIITDGGEMYCFS